MTHTNKRYALSSKTRKILRNYANALFHKKRWSAAKRRYVFYLILRSSLDWVYDGLLKTNLEKDEIESEIFLLTTRLFSRYDPYKSSIVPYIEKHLPWKVGMLIKKYTQSDPNYEAPIEYSYEMDDNEFYLTSPGFLFEKKWLAKHLSQAQKHLILRVLLTDSISLRSLAKECRLSKSAVAGRLQYIADIIEERFKS